MGREEDTERIRDGIRSRTPVEIHAPCGFGKTELLRSLPGVYFEVGAKKSEDVLRLLVHRLYATSTPNTPLRLSMDACAQLVSRSRVLLLLDDVPADPSFASTLLDQLPGCDLVFAGQRPVLGDRAAAHRLGGLSEEAAPHLLARELRRPVLDHELPGVRRLVAAVAGSPLQLKQAAALEREDPRLTFDHLAEIAERDAGALDRRSLGRMSDGERRALAVVAFAAGARLPSAVISGMGDIAYAAQFLTTLHGRGIVECSGDRFGLPVCRAEGYRQALSRYIQLASAVRGLCEWLVSLDPAGDKAGSGVEGALSLLGVLAEQREWGLVVRLVRVAEPVLFAWGRWRDWGEVLELGMEAAGQVGDKVSEAYFTHQKGTLEYGEGRPQEAYQLLERALRLREAAGDREGAEVTRHNLDVINPPQGSGGGRGGRRGGGRGGGRGGDGGLWRRARPILTYVAAAIAVVALVTGAREMVGGFFSGDGSGDEPTPAVSGGLGGTGNSGGSGDSDGSSTTSSGTTSSGTTSSGTTSSGTTSSAGGPEGNTGSGSGSGSGTTGNANTSGTNTGNTSTGNTSTSNTNTGNADGETTEGPNLTPAADVSPVTLAIPDTTVRNQTESGPVTITNTGGGTLTIGVPGISGADAGDFTVAGECDGVSLTGGSSCTFRVSFAPQTAGAKSATLEIPHSAAGAPVRLALTATALGLPDLYVRDVRLSEDANQLLITVDNLGDGDAAASTLDVTMGGAKTNLPVDPIPALDYNEVPYDIPAGCYDIEAGLTCGYTVELDPGNTLPESNEDNNGFASAPVDGGGNGNGGEGGGGAGGIG